MSFKVGFANRRKEGRDGHEATDLTQAGKVQRDTRHVSGSRVFRVHVDTQSVQRKKGRVGRIYRINVADVPRQRPCTPEEETIDRVVERMAPACLDKQRGQVRSQKGEEG